MQINGSSAYSNNTIGMDYAVSVAKKAKNFTEQQGMAALTLIDSATQVGKVAGAEAASGFSYGSKIDVTA